MMLVKISPTDQALIEELRKRQDYHAFSLGVLEAEFLQRRAKLLDVAGHPSFEQLGALQWEHDQKQAFWFEKIQATERAQRHAGETALRSVGVDPDADEFKIEGDAVLVLHQGAWLPLER